MDAILVGVGTLLADDPRLTNRRPPLASKGPHNMVRVVLDTHARTPPTAAVMKDTSTSPLWIFVGPDAPAHDVNQLERQGARVLMAPLEGDRVSLPSVMETLGKEGITSLLVEGGSAVHASLLAGRLAQRAAVVVTPRFLGNTALPLALWTGPDALESAPHMDNARWRALGNNALLTGLIRYAP
jgi:diaminohydroxyphosphoribosylaminopyrimidine deaminase/5-amino-6-(5-phosphoribosylamino)uracil reductase